MSETDMIVNVNALLIRSTVHHGGYHREQVLRRTWPISVKGQYTRYAAHENLNRWILLYTLSDNSPYFFFLIGKTFDVFKHFDFTYPLQKERTLT
jgi:hypothetical protein